MANIAERKMKRFHEGTKQVTFGYAEDSLATTLLVTIQTPDRKQTIALDTWQTKEFIK